MFDWKYGQCTKMDTISATPPKARNFKNLMKKRLHRYIQ